MNQNILEQLNIFSEQELSDQTLSRSDRLAKILALPESDKDFLAKGVVLSSTQLPRYLASDQSFLFEKTLRELSAQTLAQTFGRLSKPLPTYGVIDANGNCLIQHGFYPKIESGYTLLDVLQTDVEAKYFLSEKMTKYLESRLKQKKDGWKSNIFQQHLHQEQPLE